ncbi:MAG: hypothetical protein AB7K68_04225 [Bacteriovoracia bacterium]
MKSLILGIALLTAASMAQAAEFRITGSAAAEMFEKLNIAEIGVRDEHGGPDFAVAKYGKNIGCQKSFSSGAVECWIFQ